MRLIYVFAFLSLFCLAPPAKGEELDAKGLLLKDQINDLIDARRSSLKLVEKKLETGSDLSIEKAGSYYAVTLPHLSVVNSDGSKTEIGMIALNAIPGEEDGVWKISAALPTPIIWMDENGNAQKRLHLGSQQFSGTWSSSLENFSSLSAIYKNVQIEYMDRPEILTLGQLGIETDLKEDANGIWNGPIKFSLFDLKIGAKNEDPSLKTAALAIGLNLSGFSPSKHRQAREKIDAYAENSAPADLLSMNGNERAAFFDMIVDVIKSSGDAFTLSFNVKDFFSARKNNVTKLENGALNLAFTNLDTDEMSLKLSQAAKNLSLKTGNEDMSGLTPQEMALNLSFDKVPLDGLLQLLRSNFSGTENKTAKQLARIETMLVLPQLLSNAGSTISIKDTTLKNKLYDANAYGQIKANKEAALGMAGDFTISLAGLDEMIKTMKNNRENVDLEKQVLADKTIQRLTLLSALGQANETADGKPARLYKFEVKENGEVLLNGTDFSVLMKNGD